MSLLKDEEESTFLEKGREYSLLDNGGESSRFVLSEILFFEIIVLNMKILINMYYIHVY